MCVPVCEIKNGLSPGGVFAPGCFFLLKIASLPLRTPRGDIFPQKISYAPGAITKGFTVLRARVGLSKDSRFRQQFHVRRTRVQLLPVKHYATQDGGGRDLERERHDS